jgi:hypothetical protein
MANADPDDEIHQHINTFYEFRKLVHNKCEARIPTHNHQRYHQLDHIDTQLVYYDRSHPDHTGSPMDFHSSSLFHRIVVNRPHLTQGYGPLAAAFDDANTLKIVFGFRTENGKWITISIK